MMKVFDKINCENICGKISAAVIVVKDLLPSIVGDQRRSSLRTFGLTRGSKEQTARNVD
jgi:hypothetical protein